MERAAVDAWLGRYVAAWKSRDAGEIGELFSEGCRYRYRPTDEPVVGRVAIVAGWLADEDAPGTFDAAYSCWAIDGERAVATGTSTYTEPERKVYDNVFLLVFDGDGRCDEFTELYLEQPSA